MTEPLKESLAHLDWVLECSRADCEMQATHWVQVHRPGLCHHPATNEDGCTEHFLCTPHLASVTGEATRVARQYNPTGLRRLWAIQRPFCPSCGRPLQHAGDVLQTVQKLAQ